MSVPELAHRTKRTQPREVHQRPFLISVTISIRYVTVFCNTTNSITVCVKKHKTAFGAQGPGPGSQRLCLRCLVRIWLHRALQPNCASRARDLVHITMCIYNINHMYTSIHRYMCICVYIYTSTHTYVYVNMCVYRYVS